MLFKFSHSLLKYTEFFLIGFWSQINQNLIPEVSNETHLILCCGVL